MGQPPSKKALLGPASRTTPLRAMSYVPMCCILYLHLHPYLPVMPKESARARMYGLSHSIITMVLSPLYGLFPSTAASCPLSSCCELGGDAAAKGAAGTSSSISFPRESVPNRSRAMILLVQGNGFAFRSTERTPGIKMEAGGG